MRNIKFILILMMAFNFGMLGARTYSVQTTKQQTIKTKKHELKGKATFYGDRYRSTRRTANGDRFDKNGYTAAHKTLPFGTIVKVTNTTNGKWVTVRINDRGPFGPGRIIDVTPKAARDLEMIRAGVVSCELEIISIPDKNKNTNI